MAGYIGTKAVNLSTTGADIAGDADVSGALDVGGAFTSQGIDDNATSTAMTLDASGNVGIGTSSPIDYYSDNLVVSAPTENGITIAAQATSNTNYLMFADGTSGDARYRGYIGYLHSTDAFVFGTSGSEAMRIDSSGNVGIGTSSPNDKLTISGSAAYMTIDRSDGEAGVTFRYNGDNTKRADIATQTNGDLRFRTNLAEAMRIDSSGKVGIGTSSPSENLSTLGNVNIGNNDSSNPASYLRFGATQYGAADIRPSDEGGHKVGLDFYTDGTGDTTIDPTFAMRIDSSGKLLVGTTSQISNAKLNIQIADIGMAIKALNNGNWAAGFYNSSGGNVGQIVLNASSTSYNTTSDYRLKTDAQPMTGASARVQALNPVNFEWIADGTRVDGFLAHEAQEVVPEAVTGTKDAMRDEEYEVTPAVLDDDGNVVTEAVMGTRSVPDCQGIDQSKLVPLLTAALQEALTEITDLKARVAALETP